MALYVVDQCPNNVAISADYDGCWDIMFKTGAIWLTEDESGFLKDGCTTWEKNKAREHHRDTVVMCRDGLIAKLKEISHGRTIAYLFVGSARQSRTTDEGVREFHLKRQDSRLRWLFMQQFHEKVKPGLCTEEYNKFVDDWNS